MLKQLKLIIYAIILISVCCFSQKVQSINVIGNKIFSERDIISWAGLNVSAKADHWLLDSALNKLARQLSARGYLHSFLENSNIVYNEDSSQAVINLIIDEGKPTFIRNIVISKTDSTFEVSNAFSFLEGQILNKVELEEVIDDLLKKYENNGYPFAAIKLTSINFISDSLDDEYVADIFIDINAGLKGTIDKIEIKGNYKTNDEVIFRELRIKLGDSYSHQEVEKLPARLNRLRFFEPVALPQFYIGSDNKGTLLIEVKEKQTNNFDGIIGYIPSYKPDENGFVTGLINVSLRNIFGTGRSTAFRWQKLDRNSQELEMKYLEPWFLSYPLNIYLGFNQRKQDTIYVQRKFEAGIEYLATESISAAFNFGTESIIPSENNANVFTVYNSSSLTTGITLKIDTRDDPYSPTSGILFNNSYSYSRKSISGPLQFITTKTKTKINLQRVILGLDFYFSLFTRQVLALKLNGRELQGSFFEISDLFRLGGTNSLRGYREDQFLGSRVFWSNLEYRLLLTRRSYVFLFFDTGYFLVKENTEAKLSKQEAFNIGYGLGLNIETALGVIGVSFAMAKGDSFSDGKIHFGLVSEF